MMGDDRTVVGDSDAPKPEGTGQPPASSRGSGARAIDSAPSGATAATGSVEQAGDQVGAYKLLSLVGEGGFGTVWLAERREPFVQRVALKLIKPGMDSKAVLGRFEQERQALAVMNHPGIARVLDGGLTPAGRPFFAMEYVKGEPITEFCDRLKLGIEERLELFEQACEAIQHAHLKGIVHRDIKPGNILAFAVEGEGPRLKVIDFGVAKAMSHAMTAHTVFTETGQMIGTPEYMSPEQADPSASDIDTRSDIYSLGVLLYELLSGALPFEPSELRSKAYREIQRIIQEDDPPSPSARLSTIVTRDRDRASRIERVRGGVATRELVSRLRGELEWIPLKAMRKEPQHRYQSAMALAEDVRNYLDGKPLVAAPESRAYRLRKMVRRNRALAIGTAAVAASLVVGLGLATWQWREAAAARDAAMASEASAILARDSELRRAAELKQVSDFQAKMLGAIDTNAAGTALMADLRARLSDALAKAGVPNDQRDADVASLARLLDRINATDTAARMIDRTILKPAIQSIDRQFKDQPLVDAQLRQALSNLYRDIGLPAEARPLQEAALETRRRMLGKDHADTIAAISGMGGVLTDQGALAEAEPFYREALEISRRVLGDAHERTIMTLGNLGFILRLRGQVAEAEALQREALAASTKLLGAEDPETLSVANELGALLEAQNKLTEAESIYRDVLAARRKTLGEDHPNTLISINAMAVLLGSQSKHAEAEPFARAALEASRRVRGEEHPDTLSYQSNLGVLLEQCGRFDEAEALSRGALDIRRRTLGEDHPDTLQSMAGVAWLLRRQDKLVEAEALQRTVLERSRQVLGADHPNTLQAGMNLASTLQARGQAAEAADHMQVVFDAFQRRDGDASASTIGAAFKLSWMLLAANQAERANALLGRTIGPARAMFVGDRAPNLAALLIVAGRARFTTQPDASGRAEAEALLLEAHGILTASARTGAPNANLIECKKALVDLYTAWDRSEPGKGHDAKAAEWQSKLPTPATP